jgi:2'-5' RNA ligase
VKSAPSIRLFFALWPDVDTRTTLDKLARSVAVETAGRKVATDNLHLTLAFLGERPAAMVPDLCAIASQVEVAPFSMSLDDVGCWRKTGIARLTTNTNARPLLELRERVVRALATLPIDIDERRFLPHVTLARHIESVVARRLTSPIEWQLDSFVLVASTLDPRGVHYEVLQTFAFT